MSVEQPLDVPLEPLGLRPSGGADGPNAPEEFHNTDSLDLISITEPGIGQPGGSEPPLLRSAGQHKGDEWLRPPEGATRRGITRACIHKEREHDHSGSRLQSCLAQEHDHSGSRLQAALLRSRTNMELCVGRRKRDVSSAAASRQTESRLPPGHRRLHVHQNMRREATPAD
ncbi:hypothetical protein EYF80_053211 [Liparis tanakae]|uniref:Uncharacterized protein n=1 Tax=Liparis tanakae TaxID=230148 RepID=A0A4Z2F706_9TELE|nr:hypothetical protein EYF80_053211 [Liparis tanakae]